MSPLQPFRPPLICLVTSRRRLVPDAPHVIAELGALERWLDAAIGLVDLIQIREPDTPPRALLALARGVAARAAGTRTAVVVNDRADVALAAGASGVHLKASGAPVERVRALLPPDRLIGRSIHSAAEARAAAGADYVIFGTVFASESKGADVVPQGLGALADAVGATRVPVLAIGGIDPQKAEACARAGAAGVAAIGLFLPPGKAPGALGISAAVQALREAQTRK